MGISSFWYLIADFWSASELSIIRIELLSRLELDALGNAQKTIEQLCMIAEQRLAANPDGVCPVEMAHSFWYYVMHSHAENAFPVELDLATCESARQGVRWRSRNERLERHRRNSSDDVTTADCAIGVEAARMVLTGLKGFREDYVGHIETRRCLSARQIAVPCVHRCPANVDIPGYLAGA